MNRQRSPRCVACGKHIREIQPYMISVNRAWESCTAAYQETAQSKDALHVPRPQHDRACPLVRSRRRVRRVGEGEV